MVFFTLLLAWPGLANEDATVKLEIIPLEPYKIGHAQHAVARLSHSVDGTPVTQGELLAAHTRQIHLLIIDEALTDFQHVHPDMQEFSHASCPKWSTCNPGEYPFTWTPHGPFAYRAWADVTPAATGKQEYARADIAPALNEAALPAFAPRMTAQMGGYRFKLTLGNAPVADAPFMAHLHVAGVKGNPLCRSGDACRILRPVMGAFAHAVGFNADFETVLHAHPVEEAPADDATGGPDLDFHLMPSVPGFYRVFIQLNLAGKVLAVPFGLEVAQAHSPAAMDIKKP